jgi:hypothetical protein
MKLRLYTILFITTIVLIVASCTKGTTPGDDGSGNIHPNTGSDTLAPVITITTPVIDQIFANGSIINVTGKLTDDLGLYQGSIRIVNDANNAIMKEQLYEIHGLLSYDFAIAYTATVTIASNYTVTVSFEDHGLNKTTKSVKIKVNP